MQLFWFTLAIALYFTLHSLLADDGVKRYLSRFIPFRLYRLGFNLFTLLSALPIIFFYFQIEKHLLMAADHWLSWLGALLLGIGSVWVVWGFKGYDLEEFLGVYQLKHNSQPSHTTLSTSGLNSLVRHPLYFGAYLIFAGLFLAFPTDAMLALALVAFLYLYFGTRLEERKLVRQFGNAYRNYQQEVPMLFPHLFQRGKNP